MVNKTVREVTNRKKLDGNLKCELFDNRISLVTSIWFAFKGDV